MFRVFWIFEFDRILFSRHIDDLKCSIRFAFRIKGIHHLIHSKVLLFHKGGLFAFINDEGIDDSIRVII